jgi:carbamoyltransferase
MKIVGFQSGHDVSYCILEDGIPIVHEELERFSREKEPPGCGLKFFFERNPDIKKGDIAGFAYGNMLNPNLDPFSVLDENSYHMARELCPEPIGYYEHHLCHAANAFYTSDFEDCLIFTVDGGGNGVFYIDMVSENNERISSIKGIIAESMGVFKGLGKNISNDIAYHLYTDGAPKFNIPKDFLDQIPPGGRLEKPNFMVLNLGRLWNNVTEKVFGLSIGHPKGNQAGTVMAMATMGEPHYSHMLVDHEHQMAQLIRSDHPLWNEWKKIADKSEQDAFDVAASLQKYTEDTFFKILTPYIEEHRPKNICFSGGVSLNCVMLAKIKEQFPVVENVFCDPVPYDGGLSLGAARLMWHMDFKKERTYNNPANQNPYLGVTYAQADVEKSIDDHTDSVITTSVTDEQVLHHLLDNKIVSVFGGGAESGRRALGNRSILANPCSKDMKQIINDKVKHRQWYRPFAPSILIEEVEEWFETFYNSPYMSFAPKFKEEVRDKIPAVVHADGTGRLQTVDKKLNPWYHSFISQWHKISGVPILLNTSFNDREPIVETPEHAINCFLRTNIDYLYFYDYGLLVEKKTS